MSERAELLAALDRLAMAIVWAASVVTTLALQHPDCAACDHRTLADLSRQTADALTQFRSLRSRRPAPAMPDAAVGRVAECLARAIPLAIQTADLADPCRVCWATVLEPWRQAVDACYVLCWLAARSLQCPVDSPKARPLSHALELLAAVGRSPGETRTWPS